MSYSLRQALPLLTKPELSLFESSRPPAVKDLTAKQLATKITRARALRDKYRDLYRRQSVQTQAKPARDRRPVGGENERTNAKAEIMAEVLTRLETQHAKVTASATGSARRAAAVSPHPAPGTPAKRTTPSPAPRTRQSKSAAAAESGPLPMRGKSGTTARGLARKKQAATALGEETVAKRGAKASAKATSAGSAASTATKGATKAKAATKAGATTAAGKAATAAKKPAVRKASAKSTTPTLPGLVKAVRKAVRQSAEDHAAEGVQTSGRKKSNAPVTSGVRGLAQGQVSTSIPAQALRENPLKADPVNKKIHAAQRSQHAQHPAKRDTNNV